MINNAGYGTSSITEILKTAATDRIVFNEYVEKEVIGGYIFKELHKRFRKDGFVLQDNSNDVGILSQCQSLQTLVSLAQDFGLDFNKPDFFPGQKGTIRQIMDDVIEDVINRVCVKNEQGETVGYIFDASPYDTDHFSEKYSNIDAITWVITSFFLILKYHAKEHEICKWEPILVDVIKYGLKYINEAFIAGEDDGNSGLRTGWNFTKDCKEPSLYFSFAVCECYLDMYSTFEPFLEYLHAEKNRRVYGLPIDRELQNQYDKKKQEYEKNRNRKVEKLQARYDEYNELARIFRLINDIDDYQDLRIDDTLYGAFEANCKKVAQKVWGFVHHDLADKFFYNDLKNTVGEAELRMSTTSDVLFNTVYVVSIMISGGLDEKLKLEQQAAELREDFETAHKKEREYNNLLESCLLAVQKAFRVYESLKSNGKDYIVDQFLIGFNEDFDGHPIAINELRKLRMRCFSLLPMLIHVNNVVSEYLVRYPQYNMKKYLEYILDNRLVGKDGAARWIWESDGFFSGSNYYFVLALNEFYNYHEVYEKTYIKIGEENQAREEEIRARHLDDLQKPGNAISDLNEIIRENKDALRQKQEKIEQLQKEIDNIKRPVEDAVREVIEEELQQRFVPLLSETFEQAVKVLTIPAVDDTQDRNGEYTAVSDNLHKLLLTYMLRTFASVPTRKLSADDYKKLRDAVFADEKKAVLGYVGNVKNAADGESELKKLFDAK